MAEFEAPSFSLGLDLDDTPPPSPSTSPNHDPVPQEVPDSDPESQPDPPIRILKRLRRAPPSSSQTEPLPSFFDPDEDDIEEFSSQEEPLQVSAHSSVQNRSVCGSSKVSLKGAGVLTSHSCSNSMGKKRKQGLDVPASVGLETGQSGFIFPNLADSPIRRCKLLDSDDDDLFGEDVFGVNKVGPSSSTGQAYNQSTPLTSLEQNRKTQFDATQKRDHASDIPASVGLETGQSSFVFPKLVTSPIPRFKLLDSDDDDDDLFGEDVGGENKVGPSSSSGQTCNRNTPLTYSEQDRKTQFDVNRNQDLWKDFSPMKNFSVPTPVFNEVFEEYFCSGKSTEVPRSGIGMSENYNETYCGVSSGYQQDEQIWEAAGPLPPAHRYFLHEDPRIQQLVRSRLCNFFPLGVNSVNQQQNGSHIDYMGQFDNGGASKTPGRVNGSTSRRSKSTNLNVEESFNASEGWVDPKIISPFGSGTSSRKNTTKRNNTKRSVSKAKNAQCKLNPSNVSGNWMEPKSRAGMPKDAGKRRVQASSQSAGHWYTGSDGRKVYVSKSGQELTGRNAYKHYRKESGTGFKKSKKKTSAKKANAKKGN